MDPKALFSRRILGETVVLCAVRSRICTRIGSQRTRVDNKVAGFFAVAGRSDLSGHVANSALPTPPTPESWSFEVVADIGPQMGFGVPEVVIGLFVHSRAGS